jgi:hypothetical protein
VCDRLRGMSVFGRLDRLINNWGKSTSDPVSTKLAKEKDFSELLEPPERALLLDRLLSAVEFPPIVDGKRFLRRFNAGARTGASEEPLR